jgi:hypothetical protein
MAAPTSTAEHEKSSYQMGAVHTWRNPAIASYALERPFLATSDIRADRLDGPEMTLKSSLAPKVSWRLILSGPEVGRTAPGSSVAVASAAAHDCRPIDTDEFGYD